jgi:hypothetical protein
MICKLIKAGQTAKKLTSYIAGKAIKLSGDLGLGEHPINHNQLPFVVQALRANHSASRACEVRHVILSTPRDTPRKVALQQLKKVAADWLKTYAPARPWMFGIHCDTGVFHGHLAVSNVGPNGRPLKIQPHDVKDMAAMTFTSHATAAKGKGIKGTKLYTKARQLAVRELATLLVNPQGNLSKPIWNELVSKGLISDFRSRSDGSLISFKYDAKRIRLATLQAFVLEQQHNKNMPITPPPSPSKPEAQPHAITGRIHPTQPRRSTPQPEIEL